MSAITGEFIYKDLFGLEKYMQLVEKSPVKVFRTLANLFKSKEEKIMNINTNNLTEAELKKEYIIKGINTDDEEIKNFLFSLGCYEGQKIIIVSKLHKNYIVLVKDARYSIDEELASAISI